jgi:uncharacterized protein
MSSETRRVTLMTKNPLSKLLELVAFDQKQVHMEREIAKLQEELDQDNKETTLCQVALERAKKHAHDSRKDVDSKELEMKALDHEEKDKRNRLDASRDQRQYNSLAKEIEVVQKKQHALEEHLVAAWKNYEQAEQEFVSKKEYCDKKLISLNTVIIEKMQQIEALRQQLKEQLTMRDEKKQGIKPELLEKYDAMYKQVSNPVVPLINSSCSACFYQVTQHILHELRRGKLAQCTYCFRFLYYPSEESAEKIENSES